MRNKKFLVVGATGHVGSKVAVLLANRGYDVTALVRRQGARIMDPYQGKIRYVVGDLTDEGSIERVVAGMDVVISTANGVMPLKNSGNAKSVNEAAIQLIAICERAKVSRFVQSSVPTYQKERNVPELWGKRLIEKRLASSPMQSIVIRNPAFMDVFIVMSGCKQAQDASFHATTKRDNWLGKMWTAMVGNLVQHGWMIAPGGANHGTPTIATRDVAEMLVGGALYEGTDNLLIESGGPQWLTWREIAATLAKKVGRKKVRIIPMPSWLPRLNQLCIAPFSASAANTFALMSFVAAYQPRWDSSEVIRKLKLQPQLTLQDYLDLNYQPD